VITNEPSAKNITSNSKKLPQSILQILIGNQLNKSCINKTKIALRAGCTKDIRRNTSIGENVAFSKPVLDPVLKNAVRDLPSA
jgi:hypothetical protein